MHNTFDHHNTPFNLSSDEWSPSILREVADQLVEVDWSTWHIAKDYECPWMLERLEALGVSVDTHEVVGDYYEDLTRWCDVQGKIEYDDDSRVLLAPSKLMQQYRVDFTWEDVAASLGYEDWAA